MFMFFDVVRLYGPSELEAVSRNMRSATSGGPNQIISRQLGEFLLDGIDEFTAQRNGGRGV